MASRFCLTCDADISQRHRVAKRCLPCAEERRKRPAGHLTPSQARFAARYAGQVDVRDIAAELECSVANIKRFFRGTRIRFNPTHYTPQQRAEVIAYYEEHGAPATQKRYPHVSVRSIVERNPHKPRQIRFTDKDYRSLAQMAGIVMADVQAKFLNRPRAHAPSVMRFWQRNMKGMRPTDMCGMRLRYAHHLLRPGFPYVCAPSVNGAVLEHDVVLWADMALWLRRGVPAFVQDGIKAMARYQRWLYGTDDVHARVQEIIDWGLDLPGGRPPD